MPYRVYGMSASGNCHKVRPVLGLTTQPFEWVEVDLFSGATRTPEFLAMNPNGKVPVLELPDGRCLPESKSFCASLPKQVRFCPRIVLPERK